MKKLIIILSIGILVNSSFAQEPGDLYLPFADNGVKIFEWSTYDVTANDMILQDDGKIITCGSINYGDDKDMLVARFNEDGTSDVSFYMIGLRSFDFELSESFTAVALQSDGKILLGGYLITGSFHGIIMRLNTDGTLDPSFNTSGFKSFESDEFQQISSIAVRENGKILVAGEAEGEGFVTKSNLASLNPDGSMDNYFGSSGITGISLDHDIYFRDLALQEDGKIVVAGKGEYPSASNDKAFVARFNYNGSLDEEFSENGYQFYMLSDYEKTYGESVIVDGNRIVVAGYAKQSGVNYYDGILYGLLQDGTYDPSFGSGMEIFDYKDFDYLKSVVLQEDGKYVACGSTREESGFSDFFLLRINQDASLDEEFGDGGIVDTYIQSGEDVANTICINNDLNLMAGGITIKADGTLNLAIACYYSGLYVGNSIVRSSEKIRIYPNPVKDKLKIKLPYSVKDYVAISIYDIDGRRIYESSQLSSNKGELSINSLSLKNGVYIICVKIRNSIYTHKFLVRK